ncbi:hypothetical protein FIM10_15765 [Sphingomonadales bacterium 56]|uniref:hypothetical protein n=1 Tax=unclassified Sphingobium TaxID=2611147 RepID=UPI0019183383|nr:MULTISPECIES: hypothetical protein [unclassified Sphingobium]MBY2930134.1 hypothetical protein [Sphingomonadales bacterium 56]MBY2960178.1 hypothetical protein [Sphingomonadales bacterium 58]CAD7340571.1 hypothetical protein SPHS8_03156 [Sphingobium sp. S8]CAD7340806.1 hypothetical protein SPHS6_03178 [Sphingobium sp. S6]
MLGFSLSAEQALLLLGRLDGRLANSPATDIWLARARVKGAAALASVASVPIAVRDLEDWICGRTPPPRHSEGLNDPLSIAALVHFALSASESQRDPIARATLNISRQLLDDRKEAEIWAPDDLVRFGPAWRAVQALVEAPYPASSVQAVAERLIAAREGLAAPTSGGQLLTTADGRQLQIDPRQPDLGWVIAAHVPAALEASGLTLRRLPSFVDLPRFPGIDAPTLTGQLFGMIQRQAAQGLAELNRLEARLKKLPDELPVTKRSKAPLLMRLELAYPGLSKMAVARLLGISHQGATKLVAQLASPLLSNNQKISG